GSSHNLRVARDDAVLLLVHAAETGIKIIIRARSISSGQSPFQWITPSAQRMPPSSIPCTGEGCYGNDHRGSQSQAIDRASVVLHPRRIPCVECCVSC